MNVVSFEGTSGLAGRNKTDALQSMIGNNTTEKKGKYTGGIHSSIVSQSGLDHPFQNNTAIDPHHESLFSKIPNRVQNRKRSKKRTETGVES